MKKIMEKGKRIVAIAAVVILLALYVVTFVSALLSTPTAQKIFKVSLLATLVIPIVVYVYLLVYRLIFGEKANDEEKES